MTGMIERSVPQRPDLDAAATVGGGIFRFEPRSNCGNLLLGLIARHARLESDIRFTPSRSAIFQFVAAAVEGFHHRGRHPILHFSADESPVEPLVRDPDDGVHDVIEALRLADDFRIAIEASLPKMVADHQDWMRVAAGVFAWLKPAAENGMHSNGVKIVRRDDASRDDLSALANAHSRAGDVADKERLTQVAASLHVKEIGPRRFVSLATDRSGQRH